jgi:hypothetical protein
MTRRLITTASVKCIPLILERLKRESLTDDDKKTLRQIASMSGALLRPLSPPADAADANKAAVLSDEERRALIRDLLRFQMK